MLQDVATVVIVRSRYDLDRPRVAVVTTRHRSVERLCRALASSPYRGVVRGALATIGPDAVRP